MFSQNNNLLLDPIVIFEGHGRPESSLTILHNLPELIKKGYQIVSLEFDNNRDLQNVIAGLENALKIADKGIRLLSGFGISVDTPIDTIIRELNLATHLSLQERKIYQAYILRKAGNEAKLALLKYMQLANISFSGIDKSGIDKSDTLTSTELMRLNEEREYFMAENLSKLCMLYQGGVIFIFGAGHYNILKKIKEKHSMVANNFNFIVFLMLSLKEINGSFAKLQIMHNNTIDELTCLGNINLFKLVLDTLTQKQIDSCFAEKVQISGALYDSNVTKNNFLNTLISNGSTSSPEASTLDPEPNCQQNRPK